MTPIGIVSLVVYMVVLLALARPLGSYMADVYEGRSFVSRFFGPVERAIYRLFGTAIDIEMNWKTYALAFLVFNILGLLVVYGLQRVQTLLPFNQGSGFLTTTMTPESAFNTAVSFATNTNWQGYGGETTMTYLTQMFGLTVQNFVSAAAGMAVLVALIRGFARRTTQTVGNFWVDLTRSTLYILLPLSIVVALVLVSQGVVQTLDTYVTAQVVDVNALTDGDGNAVTEQVLAVGPAASQVAIKQLGTNGGGFYNVNSAHPFENSTPFSNFVELLAILLIPAALCHTFGKMVGDTRQGWAVLAAMTAIFVVLLGVVYVAETAGNPVLVALGVDARANDLQPGGNMEGKEARFGVPASTLWAAATTAASNGSVNSMHDSYTPLGGLVPMWLMQLGEVIYGGVGSGLYGMLIFAIIAVFISGLMVGRTPEYLGKKIEAYEMKMASLVILIPCALVTIGTAIAVVSEGGVATIWNTDPAVHGFSEVLYALSSASNNNGSAFAGLGANTLFYNTLLGVCMFLARYWLAIPTLAIAGSLARKKILPAGAGTLPTHRPLFVVMLIGVVLIVGALTFFPALALGPIVEHLMVAQAVAGQ
ncbi:MAG TPA: potassium-transporting ATPase subunit KdpA [Anaerolineales bacterium]|nr:potassium-transporting ATPase subunit KdpA [Anaerolineales bacterium]